MLSKIKNMSVIYKVTIPIIIITVLVFGTAVVYNYEFSKGLLLKNVEENTRNLINSAINKSEGFFVSVEKIAQNINYVLEDRYLESQEIYSLIEKIVKKNDEVFGSCLAFEPFEYDKSTAYFAPYCYEKDGEVYCNNLAERGYDYPLWDWYQIPKVLKRDVWSEPYFDEGGGESIMSTYSVPIFDESRGNIKAIFTLDLSLEWLNELVSQIKIFDTGYAFLISRKGTIITHPESEYIMNESIFSLAKENEYEELREIGQKMINSEEQFIKVNSVLYNGVSWLYFAPLSNNHWSIGFVFPEKELYADLNELTFNIVAIIVIGIVIIAFVVFFIVRKLTKPLVKLSAITGEIGKGNLDVTLPENNSKDEIGKLRDSFFNMQQSLKEYIINLENTLSAKKRMESELSIAKEIQLGFVPKKFKLAGHDEELEVYGHMEPAREVGGDLFDFFFLDENRICFAIGDVSGKGIPAALFMAVTTSLFNEYRNSNESGTTVKEIAEKLNRNLCARNPESFFITMFICILDLSTGELKYCNCGHNKSYLISKGGSLKFLEEVNGMPLGVAPLEYGISETIKLEKGDKIFLYTDGIVEAFNEKGEIYTEKRLEDNLMKYSDKKIKDMVKIISESVAEFAGEEPQSDDVTMFCVHFKGR